MYVWVIAWFIEQVKFLRSYCCWHRVICVVYAEEEEKVEHRVFVCVVPVAVVFQVEQRMIRQELLVLYLKTFAHLWQYLAEFFLESEMFKKKVVEKIKMHVLRAKKIFFLLKIVPFVI
jgi:hypothetical protein